jgi:HAD superfamily hydrolase (TIGR01509 family)
MTGELICCINGHVIDGAKKAAFFTGLDWVKSQCKDKLGFTPCPGTLNLKIEDIGKIFLSALDDVHLKILAPPDKAFCTARVCPVRIGEIGGALIMPDADVDIHGDAVLEVIAPVHLREALGLKTGDRVSVQVNKIPGSYALKVKAALFDLDGTLVDSIDAYYRIVEIALNKLGLPQVSRKLIAAAAVGDRFNWNLVMADVPEQSHKETVQKAWQIIEQIYPDEFLKKVRPFPFVGDLLNTIHVKGIRIGVVTSTPEKNIDEKGQILDQAGVSALIEQVVHSGDVERKKPFPDPLLLCCRRMGLDPDQCVYVGDMGIDIEAGRAAGMKTAGVLTGFMTRSELAGFHPDLILPSAADLSRVLERTE